MVTRAALLVAAVFVAAGCQPGAGRSEPQASEQVIAVVAREFAFEPAEFRVRPGRVTFRVKNEGAIEHEFAIDRPGHRHGADHLIPPGRVREITEQLAPGRYTVVCNIAGHKDAGMTATLVVAP